MPVLLASDQAPTLDRLLADANAAGLDYAPAADTPEWPRICGLGSLGAAGASELSFLSNPRWLAQVASTRAAAVLLTPQAWQALQSASQTSPGFLPILCSNPYLMYAQVAQWFDQRRLAGLPAGVHPTAVIDTTARLEAGVSVGPHCVIEGDVVIGAGTRLGPACVVGQGSRLGRDCLLHARVTLYHCVEIGDRAVLHSGVVLGADGFGFAPDPREGHEGWTKIAQLGGVRIGHDVEIGANTTVDRGALDPTVLGNGVKLDNQIMIAHNVQIGDHTAMAACVGVAGSTRIGQRCTIGGAAMLSGHLQLTDDVHVSGGTAITASVGKPGRYTGVFPFEPHGQWQRNAAVLGQLAQLRRRLRTLELATDDTDASTTTQPGLQQE